MLRCLHLADLHLGWSASFLADQADEFSRRRDGLLHRVANWAVDPRQQIDLVLLVGDLFDTHRPDVALVESVLADLRALVVAGKTVVTVPGNHDEITYHDSVYQRCRERWPGVLVTNPLPGPPLELTIGGSRTYIYSLAYTGGLTRIGEYLQPVPRVAADGIHIGAFHGSLDWQSEERGLPLASEALGVAAYDYVALGHFHSPRQMKKGRTTIAYAGSIEGKGFSDLGCGQLTLVDFVEGTVRTQTIPWSIPNCRVEPVDVGILEDSSDLDNLFTGWADPGLLLRVELQGAAGWLLDKEQLLGRHRHSFYHLEIVDDSLYLADELLAGWAEEATVRGMFVRRLLERLSTSSDQGERQLVQLALRRGVAAFLEGGD